MVTYHIVNDFNMPTDGISDCKPAFTNAYAAMASGDTLQIPTDYDMHFDSQVAFNADKKIVLEFLASQTRKSFILSAAAATISANILKFTGECGNVKVKTNGTLELDHNAKSVDPITQPNGIYGSPFKWECGSTLIIEGHIHCKDSRQSAFLINHADAVVIADTLTADDIASNYDSGGTDGNGIWLVKAKAIVLGESNITNSNGFGILNSDCEYVYIKKALSDNTRLEGYAEQKDTCKGVIEYLDSRNVREDMGVSFTGQNTTVCEAFVYRPAKAAFGVSGDYNKVLKSTIVEPDQLGQGFGAFNMYNWNGETPQTNKFYNVTLVGVDTLISKFKDGQYNFIEVICEIGCNYAQRYTSESAAYDNEVH